MTKILLDTNVLIYYLDSDSKYFPNVNLVLSSPTSSFLITTKVLSEYFAVGSKMGLSASVLKKQLEVIQSASTLLYPSMKSTKVFLSLIEKYQPKGNQVYDLEIVSVMLANGIDTIFTFNKKDFTKIEEIQILEHP